MNKTTTCGNARWTEADIDKLAALKVAGATDAEIAKTLGRTVKAIGNQLRDAQQQKTKTGQRLQHLIGIKQQAKAIKAQPKVKPTATPGSKPLKHNAPWTEQQNAKLVKLFAVGTDPDAMSKEMSRTIHSVLGQLHKLDILSFDKTKGTYYTKPVAFYKVVEPAVQVAK